MNSLPFAETVLLWRLERGMTQAALSRASRVSRPNLSAIERGAREVTLSTLRALAVALAVRPGVLVDGVPPYAGAPGLSREQLERIAKAAITGAILSDARERILAGCLRETMGGQIARAAGARRHARLSEQSSHRTHLRLKAVASSEDVASLIARVNDGLQRQ